MRSVSKWILLLLSTLVFMGDASSEKSVQEFKLGERIEVYYPRDEKWYPAKYFGKCNVGSRFDYTIIYDYLERPSGKKKFKKRNVKTLKEHVRRPIRADFSPKRKTTFKIGDHVWVHKSDEYKNPDSDWPISSRAAKITDIGCCSMFPYHTSHEQCSSKSNTESCEWITYTNRYQFRYDNSQHPRTLQCHADDLRRIEDHNLPLPLFNNEDEVLAKKDGQWLPAVIGWAYSGGYLVDYLGTRSGLCFVKSDEVKPLDVVAKDIPKDEASLASRSDMVLEENEPVCYASNDQASPSASESDEVQCHDVLVAEKETEHAYKYQDYKHSEAEQTTTTPATPIEDKKNQKDEKRRRQLRKEIETLKDENSKLESEMKKKDTNVSELTKEIQCQRTINEEVAGKNWKLQQTLKELQTEMEQSRAKAENNHFVSINFAGKLTKENEEVKDKNRKLKDEIEQLKSQHKAAKKAVADDLKTLMQNHGINRRRMTEDSNLSADRAHRRRL